MELLQGEVEVGGALPLAVDYFAVDAVVGQGVLRDLDGLGEDLEGADGTGDLADYLGAVVQLVLEQRRIDLDQFGFHLYLLDAGPPKHRPTLIDGMEVVPHLLGHQQIITIRQITIEYPLILPLQHTIINLPRLLANIPMHKIQCLTVTRILSLLLLHGYCDSLEGVELGFGSEDGLAL